MGETRENLSEAFAGESQANRTYLFFAEKAEQEGYKGIARLFRAAAEAETVHARNHLQALQGIKSTAENLRIAVSGEHHEFTSMYPGFVVQAESEGEAKAERSFRLANEVEQTHHGLFGAALKKLESGQADELVPFYVCQICGHTVEDQAPDRCPVCGAPQKMFRMVE